MAPSAISASRFDIAMFILSVSNLVLTVLLVCLVIYLIYYRDRDLETPLTKRGRDHFKFHFSRWHRRHRHGITSALMMLTLVVLTLVLYVGWNAVYHGGMASIQIMRQPIDESALRGLATILNNDKERWDAPAEQGGVVYRREYKGQKPRDVSEFIEEYDDGDQ